MRSDKSSSSSTASAGLLLGGQFLLERPLGAGGMGAVWVAEDTRLRRPVAIKFLSSSLFAKASARQRFEREARLATRIRSPHVVQVYSQGFTDAGDPYLVMELLEGEDLASRLAHAGPLRLSEAASILQQVSSALGRAHAEGLIHRDIKPHNIFLTPEPNGQCFVKLLDFGIAKELREGFTALTLSGELVGTLAYMSPELLMSPQSAAPAADIWALGVVVYEMLTGKLPFDATTLPELVYRISEARFAPASSVNTALPTTLDGFFERAIQSDLTKRFSTIRELEEDFARIAQPHSSGFVIKAAVAAPVSSTSPGLGRPGPAWHQHSWLKLLAVGLVAGLLMIAVLRVLWPLQAKVSTTQAENMVIPADAPRHAPQEPAAKRTGVATFELEPVTAPDARIAAEPVPTPQQWLAPALSPSPAPAAPAVVRTAKRASAPSQAAPSSAAAPEPRAKANSSVLTNYGF